MTDTLTLIKHYWRIINMTNPLAAALRAKKLLNQLKYGSLKDLELKPTPHQSGPMAIGEYDEVRPLPVDAKPISLREAFGGAEYNTARDMGLEFMEKPSSMEDIMTLINPRQIPMLEEALGRSLNTYNRDDIVRPGRGSKEFWPLGDIKPENLRSSDEEMFILRDPETNERHLVDRTGANSYIRMWSKIGDK